MSAAYKVARIDLGAAIVRADHLRQRPSLRFLADKLREKKSIDELDLSTLDGFFFERLVSEPEIHRDDLVVISNTWMLHQ